MNFASLNDRNGDGWQENWNRRLVSLHSTGGLDIISLLLPPSLPLTHYLIPRPSYLSSTMGGLDIVAPSLPLSLSLSPSLATCSPSSIKSSTALTGGLDMVALSLPLSLSPSLPLSLSPSLSLATCYPSSIKPSSVLTGCLDIKALFLCQSSLVVFLRYIKLGLNQPVSWRRRVQNLFSVGVCVVPLQIGL